MNERRVISISTGTIIKILAVLLGLGFLYIIRDVLALVLVSWLLASAFFPAVDWMYRVARIPRPLGLAAMYLMLGGTLVVVLMLLTPVILQQLEQLAQVVPGYLNQASQWWNNFTNTPSAVSSFGNFEPFSMVASNLLTTAFGVFSTVVSILLVLVLTFYFTAAENNVRQALQTLLPNRYSSDVTELLSRIQSRLGLWLRGQLILSLLVGCLVYVGLTILGIRYALVLALLAMLLEIVPFIGPVISGVVAALLTLSMGYGWTMVALVVLLYFIVQQLDNNIITPKILGKSVQINPLLVIIAIMIGASLAGIVGALLAVPVAAIISEIAKDVWAHRSADN